MSSLICAHAATSSDSWSTCTIILFPVFLSNNYFRFFLILLVTFELNSHKWGWYYSTLPKSSIPNYINQVSSQIRFWFLVWEQLVQHCQFIPILRGWEFFRSNLFKSQLSMLLRHFCWYSGCTHSAWNSFTNVQRNPAHKFVYTCTGESPLLTCKHLHYHRILVVHTLCLEQ